MKKRGFEVVSTFKNKAIALPKRHTAHSAGYDIKVGEAISVPPKQIAYVKTGLKVFMDDNEVLLLVPRSSLAKKHSLVLINSVGVIDGDYYDNPENEGHIFFQVYNISDETVTLPRDERICQGIFTTYLKADHDEVAGERNGGFGSTGHE